MSNIWNDRDEEIADEVNDLVEEESRPQFSHLTQEVMRRFERAKLYETLLKHKLFAPGSADQNTIDSVEDEIKTFVIERIETLMGIRQQAATQGEFSADEVNALKLLASRVIAKSGPQSTASEPKLQTPPLPPEPSIMMVQAKPRPNNGQPSRSMTVGGPQPPLKRASKRRKSENVSITGQDLSQASSPNALPMPSPEEMNAVIAQQAASVMAKGTAIMGNLEGVNPGNLINTAVASRAHIKEEG